MSSSQDNIFTPNLQFFEILSSKASILANSQVPKPQSGSDWILVDYFSLFYKYASLKLMGQTGWFTRLRLPCCDGIKLCSLNQANQGSWSRCILLPQGVAHFWGSRGSPFMWIRHVLYSRQWASHNMVGEVIYQVANYLHDPHLGGQALLPF